MEAEVKEVFRIELPESGKGIFSAIKNRDIMLKDHPHGFDIAVRHYGPAWPNFMGDAELKASVSVDEMISKHYRFAYNSCAKLNEAFTREEIREAIDMGFRVYKLKVDKYYQSAHQTVFIEPLIKEDISDEFK